MKTFTRALFFLLLIPTFVFAQTNQRVVPYGTSCSSATIGWQGMPDTGDTFNVTIAGAPANSLVGLFVGFSDRKWVSAGLPLPQKLHAWGARGCVLWASPDLTFTAMTDNAGNATFPIQIPNSPAYNGRKLYAQAFIPQPGANPLGITFTNALRIVIRQPIVMRDTIGPNSSYTDGHGGMQSFTDVASTTLLISPSQGSTLTVPAVLKKVRAVGYPGGAGASMSCYNWSVRVWSSLAAAQANPVQGDIATVPFNQPSYGPTVFGTTFTGTGGSVNGLTYDVGFNMLPSNVILQPGVPYNISPVSVSSGCGNFKISETSMTPGPTDHCIFAFPISSVTNLQCTSPWVPPLSTGVNAVELVASPLQ